MAPAEREAGVQPDGMRRRKGREPYSLNKRAVGTAYERQAGAFLSEQGYEILQYNYRCARGEIDIIAREGGYLVFVEVKYRRDPGSGAPAEAVNQKKQRAISRTALYYCLSHGYGETTPCRFDVVAALGDGMRVIKNAFEYTGA